MLFYCIFILGKSKKTKIRTLHRLVQGSDLLLVVDLKGIEPSNLTDANRALSRVVRMTGPIFQFKPTSNISLLYYILMSISI